jgi:hypothetical protein
LRRLRRTLRLIPAHLGQFRADLHYLFLKIDLGTDEAIKPCFELIYSFLVFSHIPGMRRAANLQPL